ncbi:MAG TPA: aspartate aminotransferase family protein [Xanthobacteraceae bacterium]|nr:aspartate aminotransferase family protein [Xanthobacteraceae bacterium]
MLQAASIDAGANLYARYVNPQWVRLLDVLQMNVNYVRCSGAELHTADGRVILDFNSGYCVHNVGHNHPRVVQAVKEELDRNGPAMLQNHVADLAGQLAARLCRLAGGRLAKAFFASSGSEGIEAAIKFARAHTGRAGILCAGGGFHGLTCGALSLMSNDFWREGFGALLPGAEFVPYGDIEDVERKLATQSFAAFILEPIQGEGGVVVPPKRYLRAVQDLCRRHKTLLVLDEVQTGLYRTGPFIAAHHFGVEPDMVVLAKALSGGLVPSSAVLMSDAVCDSVYSSLRRALVHTSTFSENGLAMRAGLAALDVLDEERLGARATAAGERLRRTLAERLTKYEMVGDVRGLGLFNAIEFKAPRSLKLRLAFESFAKIHPALFGQILVMRLFRDHRIMTQVCGNNFMALKVSPPLVVDDSQLDRFVSAVEQVVNLMHTSGGFWSEALGIATRVMRSI